MHLEIPLLESGELFDSKPLDKKLQLIEKDLLVRKNLSIAFSQCISSYVVSEVKESEQVSFGKTRPKTEREPVQKCVNKHQHQKQALKKIFQTKKSQIAKLATFVSQKMCDIASSVLDQYKSKSSQNSTKVTNSGQTSAKSQLNESNKNFLIQLFTETGLLKYYKGMDRTFSTLITQAQKAYYGVKQFVINQSLLMVNKNQKEMKKYIQEMKEDQLKLCETTSGILSMKKRHKEASSRLSKYYQQFEEVSNTKGYETEEYNNDNQILEEDDYMILAETKDTRQENNQREESQISDGLYFSDFSSHHFGPTNVQPQNQLNNHLLGTHFVFQKLISNMKFSSNKQSSSDREKQQDCGRLKFH